MKSKLPDGWASAKLGDVLSLEYGSALPAKVRSNEGFPVYGSNGIVGLHEEALIEGPAIIVGRKGSFGEVTWSDENCWAIDTTYYVRPKGAHDLKFLYYLLLNSGLKKLNRSTTIPGLNREDAYKVKFLLPPVSEQPRIVAQLDAVMQKLEASQERLDKLPDLLKKFRQAVLAAAVSGNLTEAWRAEQPQGETGADLLDRIRAERRAQWEDKQRAKLSGEQLSLNDSWKSKYEEPAAPDTSELPELPEGWTWCRLDNVAEMCLGKMLDNAKNQGTPQPYMGNINVRWGAFDLEDLKTMRFTSDEDERYSVEKGDLVICEGGEPGRAAVWESESSIKIQKALHRVRPNHAFLTSYFLYYNLRLDAVTHRLDSYFTGTGIQHFTGKALARYIIPIPPKGEQQEIIHQVNHYFGLADQLEARFEQAAALVEQLPQALLAKAFSGQLVPQDLDDEPASALLEQLYAEPAAPAKGKRGRKAKVATEAPLFE